MFAILTMKAKTLILIFAVGVAGVFSNPLTKQEITDENTEPPALLFENNTETKDKPTTDKEVEKQSEYDDSDRGDEIADKINSDDTKFEIVIEESIDSPTITHLPNVEDTLADLNPQQNEIPITDQSEDTIIPIPNDDLYPEEGLPAFPPVPGEIMMTAEGFVPIPIIRRRKPNTRRRLSNRRVFWRHPYHTRRFHYYPHYYYSRFYRPSSLRRYF